METIALSKNVKLLQPQEVAMEIIKGIDKGKAVIIPGFDGRMLVLFKRLFPSLLERIMVNTIEKVKK